MYGKTMMKKGGTKKLVKKGMGGPGGPGDPPKKIITANVSRYNNSGKPTGIRGLQKFKTTAETEYSKYPEGKVSDRYNDVAISTNNPAESYKIKNSDETAGRRKEGYLVEKTRAYTLPMKEMKASTNRNLMSPNIPPAKKTYKTGGMVNANSKLVANKSAGSKGVKVKVNPKATASNTAKKPSKPRSKAPKKALPKAKLGMSMKSKKSC